MEGLLQDGVKLMARLEWRLMGRSMEELVRASVGADWTSGLDVGAKVGMEACVQDCVQCWEGWC